MTAISLEERVRSRAYKIFVERGQENGHALEDWLRAEAELLETNAEEEWQSVLGQFAEQLADLFYSYRNLLAPDFGVPASAATWEEIAPTDRDLMIATARMVLVHLATEPSENALRRLSLSAKGAA